MSDYGISQIYTSDTKANALVDKLLAQEGIRRDKNLDYTCAMYDNEMNIIATGSCFDNTLRCMAVDHRHQGESLMNEIVTHLIQFQFSRGNIHLFLYTKWDSAKFFSNLGFYEIAKIDNQLVFMENKRTGFKDYLSNLKNDLTKQQANLSCSSAPTQVAAIVMNANPFTLGHLHLIEQASSCNDRVHVFIVSEDTSLVPFTVRKKLVITGTSHLNNICYHDSGPYIISNATFPSYFQKDEGSVIKGHAHLDLSIFSEIAKALQINARYVGEEPNSIVTNIYNTIMKEQLPTSNVSCTIIPRKEFNSEAISASTVRQALKCNNWALLEKILPKTTLNYFCSDEATPIIKKIQSEDNVIHY